MIKIVFCVRRLEGVSREAFSRYWLEEHGALVREVASHLNIARYVQSHTFGDPLIAPAIAARGELQPEYDGIAELWWKDIDAIVSAGATKEGRDAGRRLLQDEKRFIDMKASALFYTREHEIIPLV